MFGNDGDDDALQQVMEKIMMGRTANLTCPFCKGDTLESKRSSYGLRLTCPSCRRYIDAPDDN